MSYNGSGVFQINSAGQPVVFGTTISDTVENALTADLATGLSTAICKDGQSTTIASIPFVLGASFGGAASFNASGVMSTSALISTSAGILDTSTRGYSNTSFGQTAQYTGPNIQASSDFAVIAGGSGGVVLLSTAAAWSVYSDETLKTAFVPFADALSKVARIKAGTGRYLTDAEDVSRSFLSAQSVKAVLPEAVGEKDGKLLLAYTDVIPLLVAALAEAKDRIEALEAR